jgi:ANTAR domain
MTIRRPARIWSLIAEQSASHGGPVSAADACVAAVAATAVTGGWLSAGQGPQPGHLVHATDGVSERLAELQLTLGEGPVPDVYATGAPVLASDLGDTDIDRRWPVFAQAARGAGAAAIFAFPLQIGAIRSGVLGLYRGQAAPLSALQFGDALIFADTATLLLLGTQHHAANGVPASPGPAGQPATLALGHAEIDQAAGMLTEQLGVSITNAYLRLRAYAFVNDLRLTDVARDIVARRLRLRPDPGASQDGGKA